MSARPMVSGRPPDIFDEYVALLADYGVVQKRCTRLFASQTAEIERLQAEAMRLRAAAPGLPERRQLAHDLELQRLRVQQLLRERMELRQRLERSTPSAEPMDAPMAQRRTAVVERLLSTVAARMRTAAQRWKQIRMLRI